MTVESVSPCSGSTSDEKLGVTSTSSLYITTGSPPLDTGAPHCTSSDVPDSSYIVGAPSVWNGDVGDVGGCWGGHSDIGPVSM